MKKLFTILSLVAAVIALLLSVLPLSNLAYIPAISALVLGVLALVIKKEKTSKKTINLAFLLTIIALGFTVYKSIFTTTEVGDIQDFEQKANQSVEESIDILENEIDVIDETVPEETKVDTQDFDTKEAKDFTETKKEKAAEKTPKPTPEPEEELEDF